MKIIHSNQADSVFHQGYGAVVAFSVLAKQMHGIQSHCFIQIHSKPFHI